MEHRPQFCSGVVNSFKSECPLKVISGSKMTILDMDSEVCNLRAEEERILASFTGA